MKNCPYCAESIQDAAVKCRFCGSMLPAAQPQFVHSAAVVHGPPCPRCGGQELHHGPWPWYLGTVGALLVKAVVCNQCGHEFDARKPQADLPTRKRNLALLLNGLGALGIVAVIGSLVAFAMSLQR